MGMGPGTGLGTGGQWVRAGNGGSERGDGELRGWGAAHSGLRGAGAGVAAGAERLWGGEDVQGVPGETPRVWGHALGGSESP